MTLRVTLLAFLAVALAAPAAAPAKKLRDRGTGFSVTAPDGGRLARDGSIYVLRSKALRVAIARVRTGHPAGAAGRQIANALRARVSRVRSAPGSWSAVLSTRSDRQTLAVRRRGRFLVLARATRRSRRSRSADLALVRSLVSTAHGGRALRLEAPIRMRRFDASDRWSARRVPDVPGWVYTGNEAFMEGAAANQGWFRFDDSFVVSNPGRGGELEAPHSSPRTVLKTVIPRHLARWAGVTISFDRIVAFPGADKVNRHSNMASSFFAFRGTVSGMRADGAFLVGVSPAEYLGWNVYYGGLSLRAGSDPRMGAALLNSWGSGAGGSDGGPLRRDPWLDEAVRAAYADGGPLDQGAFNLSAARWNAYIRQ